jgi:flagellar hook-associated protein 1 FlgK
MSTEALGTALSGLRVAQKGMDVLAANISNANTEGYTAKSLPQENVIGADRGLGVRYGEVTRFVDKAIQRDYRSQLGVQNYYSTKEAYLGRIMAFHGSSAQETNISAQLGKLNSSFIELSSTPDSTSAQRIVMTQATQLAKSFNSFSSFLNDMRNEIQSTLKIEVSELNSLLKQVADYNKRIQTLQNVGKSTADIEDQRDILVKKVSEKIDITYYTDGDGTLVLQAAEGRLLVDTEAREINFDGSPVTTSSSYPETIDGIILVDGQDGTDLSAYNLGGKLGALVSLRDKELMGYSVQLDELAHKIATRFDDQDLRLFVDSTGTVPANNAASISGFASQIRVNPSIVDNPGLIQQGTTGPAVNAGSNAVIMRVINYTFGRYKDAANTPNVAFNLSNNGYAGTTDISIIGDPNATLDQFVRAMLDSQAADNTVVKNAAETESQYTQEVLKRMNDISSVDTDQEMGRMIELQKSYSASAKMINALDGLFRELLNAI